MTDEPVKKSVRKARSTSTSASGTTSGKAVGTASPATGAKRSSTAPKSTALAGAAKPKTVRRKKTGSVAPSPELRQQMIAERAYYLAEARGFVPGDTQADWLAAERWIDAQISD